MLPNHMRHTHDHLEIFAGQMAVTRAWVDSGYQALAVERNFDVSLDL